MRWGGESLHYPHDHVILLVREVMLNVGQDTFKELATYHAPVTPHVLPDLLLLPLALVIL